MATPKDKHGRPLHGAALAAHKRAGHHGGGKKGGKRAAGRKSNPANPPAANPGGRRRRRRNPNVTFVQALGKVAGSAAAMFGSGVLVTLGVSKIAPGSKWSAYGIPLATAALGAGIATRYPLIGAGVAAGAAAPFVLPVASRMLQPAETTASTVKALRAVAMGSNWRNLRAVQMGTVYAQ